MDPHIIIQTSPVPIPVSYFWRMFIRNEGSPSPIFGRLPACRRFFGREPEGGRGGELCSNPSFPKRVSASGISATASGRLLFVPCVRACVRAHTFLPHQPPPPEEEGGGGRPPTANKKKKKKKEKKKEEEEEGHHTTTTTTSNNNNKMAPPSCSFFLLGSEANLLRCICDKEYQA